MKKKLGQLLRSVHNDVDLYLYFNSNFYWPSPLLFIHSQMCFLDAHAQYLKFPGGFEFYISVTTIGWSMMITLDLLWI